MTVLDSLITSLSRVGEYNGDDQVAPAVILWPDKERRWEQIHKPCWNSQIDTDEHKPYSETLL